MEANLSTSLKIKTLDDFVIAVRHFMRDYPALNRIIDAEETSDRTIKFITLLSIDEFNTQIGLQSNASFETFPSYSLLLRKVVGEILLSLALLNTRNYLQYNVNGTSVSFSDKGQLYLNLWKTLDFYWQQGSNKIKIRSNLEKAMDITGYFSEYSYINYYGWGMY